MSSNNARDFNKTRDDFNSSSILLFNIELSYREQMMLLDLFLFSF